MEGKNHDFKSKVRASQRSFERVRVVRGKKSSNLYFRYFSLESEQ